MALINLLKKNTYSCIDQLEFVKNRYIRFTVMVYSNAERSEILGSLGHDLQKPMDKKVVLSRSLISPPESPEVGDTYAIPVEGEELWGGQVGTLATWNGGVWFFTFTNDPVYVKDEDLTVVYDQCAKQYVVRPDSEKEIAWNMFFSKEAMEETDGNLLKNAYNYLKVFYSDSAPQDC